VAQSTGAVAPVRPWKRCPGRVSAALLEPRAAPAIAHCRVCPLSASGPSF